MHLYLSPIRKGTVKMIAMKNSKTLNNVKI